MTPLRGGYRNTNFKVQVASPPLTAVLRVYEHAPSLCQKEADLMRLVAARVPVPEILFAAPLPVADVPAFAIFTFAEGVTLRDLKQTRDKQAIAQAAYSSGQVLAAVGEFRFAKAGWLSAGPTVTVPLLEGADPLPRFVDLCLDSIHFQRRITPEVRSRIHDLVWSWAARLSDLDTETSLVHCDFGMRNLLVRPEQGKWNVAALLDWEFAVAGSPLIDVGHFLRYELRDAPLLEPHFSDGYRNAGGKLPVDWRPLARIIDLSALAETFTRAELPENVEREVAELIHATAEDRDPRL
ncbi:MAG: phosphotransferase family protein [Actinomycetota bacterium]